MYEGHDLKITVAEGSARLRYNRWPGAFDRMTHDQQAQWDAAMQPDNDRMNAATLAGRDLALWKYQRYMRSEEHTSQLQSLMRIAYAVLCLQQKQTPHTQ